MTVVGCIEDKRYILSATTGMCNAHAVLLHMCHLLSEHVLKMRFVSEWRCVVVQNFRTPIQFHQLVKSMPPFKLSGCFGLRSPSLLFLKIFLFPCFLAYSFPFLLPSLSSILQGILSSIMSSFLFDSTIGISGNDSGGSIEQPMMDREVISIGGSSSKDTSHRAFDSECSSSKRVRASHCTSGG